MRFASLPLRSQLALQRAGCVLPAQARRAFRAGRIHPGRELAPRAFANLCRFLRVPPPKVTPSLGGTETCQSPGAPRPQADAQKREMDTGSRPEWAARVAAELYQLGARGSLRELVALALNLWASEGGRSPVAVARERIHLLGKQSDR